MHRRLHLLNAVLFVLLIAGSLWTWDDLPARIPVHFSLSGTADRYADATLGQWMLLPLTGGAVAVILYASAWFVGTKIEWVRVPNQETYASLSDAHKRRVVALPQRFMYGLATAVLVLFGVLQVATYDVATGTAETLPPYWIAALIAFVVGTLGGCVWLALAMKRTVHRLWEDESDG